MLFRRHDVVQNSVVIFNYEIYMDIAVKRRSLFSLRLLSLSLLALLALSIYLIDSNVLTLLSPEEQPIGRHTTVPEESARYAKLKGQPLDLTAESIKAFRLAGVDGQLRLDDNNQLIIDRDLRHWIDYHLSAIGERSLEQIKRWLLLEIAQLQEPGRSQAKQLLKQYLAYKEALADYQQAYQSAKSGDDSMADVNALQARHDWQKRLRREYMQPQTVEVFWQQDEVIDDYALQRLVIRNKDISPEQRLREFQNLDEQRPQEWAEFRDRLQQSSRLAEQVQTLRDQGANEGDIRQHRQTQVGDEATARLEALDRQQLIWQGRIRDYKQQRDYLTAVEGLDAQEKQRQIDDYIQRNFTAREALRLTAASELLAP